jgi:hypothetical protein
LEIQGMTLPYWLILFSTCSFANLLGLNISSSFNSAKVIYILIPIIIIPQLLFSGIIVRFDKLNPIFASQEGVPWIGNIMASRWAYEAIAVTQYKWNEYEEEFFELEKRKKFSNWKKDYWVTELKNRAVTVERAINNDNTITSSKELILLKNEITKENDFLSGLQFDKVDLLTPEKVTPEVMDELQSYFNLLTEHYRRVYLKADKAKENSILAMTNTEENNEEFQDLINNHKNDQLEIFATNRNDMNYIVEHNGQLIQKKDLIYLMPYNSSFFGAHFYAPAKNFFGKFIDTFVANLMVLWGMTLILIFCLFFDVFPRTIKLIGWALEVATVKLKKRD